MNKSMNNFFASGLVFLLLLSACKEDVQDELVGTLERDRIELKVETSEPILFRGVQDGELVEPGVLILQQDPARLEARLAQAKAQRDQAAARLAEIIRGPRTEAIAGTQAQLQAAQSLTTTAMADLQRTRSVFEKGLSTQADLDRAEGNWENLAAQEKAVRQSLAAQLHGSTIEELQQAEAALQGMEAQLTLAEIDLQRSSLLAPVKGRIDKMLYQVGERPVAGATVAVLLDDSRVFARVYVPEYLRAGIQAGKQLQVQVDGIAQSFTGTVRWVSTDANFTPYFALTEHDRSRLSYLAEIDLPEALDLPSGVPLSVPLHAQSSDQDP
jgi:HlyD family secretion protein